MKLQKYSIAYLKKRYRTEKDTKIRERLQIILYLREGYVQREVSSMIHISTGIVPYWKKRFEKQGVRGLRDKKGRGRKSKLRKVQLHQILAAVDRGIKLPDGYRRGYKTKDVKIFIRESFSIWYSDRHCRRLLRKMRYRLKVPRPRNKSRNQNNIDEFKRQFKKNFPVWTKIQ